MSTVEITRAKSCETRPLLDSCEKTTHHDDEQATAIARCLNQMSSSLSRRPSLPG